MKVQKKYFVGKNRPGIWASVYAYKPRDEKMFKKRGEIFAAAVLEGPAGFDASVAGNLLLDILHETYFESDEKSVLLALEEAARTTKNRLLNLVENDQNAAISGINFDLVTFVVKDKFIFTVRIGDGVLKIFRNGNLQDLSAGFKDPTGEGNYEVLSALIEKNDVIFISTPQTLEAYSEDEIFEGVSEFNEINLKNKMIEDDSRVAMLLIGLGLDKKALDEENAIMPDAGVGQNVGQNVELDPSPTGFVGQIGEEGETSEVEEIPFSKQKRKLNIRQIKEKATLYAKKGSQKASQKARAFTQKSKGKINEYRIKRRNKSAGIMPSTIPTADPTEVSITVPTKTQADGAVMEKEKRITEKSTFQVYFSRVLGFSKKAGRKIYKFIKEDLLDIKQKGLYLRDARTGSINYRVVAAIFIVLFVVFFVGMRIRRTALDNARAVRDNKQLVEQLATDVNNISTNSVFTINTPDNIDEREAVLGQINTLEQRIANTEVKQDYKTKLEQYSSHLTELKVKLLREILVSSPLLITDLGANYEGANPSDIAIVKGKLYVSDKDRNVIYEIKTDGSQVREAVTEDIKGPRLLASDPTGEIVLVDQSDTSLALVNGQTGQVTRFPGMSKSKFAAAQEMEVYKVGNTDIRLYLAMSTAPQIQQVNKHSDSYSDGPKNRWSGSEFAGLTDIDLLDGKFLVIKKDAGFMRLFSNSVMNTSITGLLSGDTLNTATKLAVDPTYIYIADPAGKRILVFTKSRGNNTEFIDLVAQYKYTGSGNIFSNIIDIEVDTTSIYVLDGAKVYKLAKSDFSKFSY